MTSFTLPSLFPLNSQKQFLNLFGVEGVRFCCYCGNILLWKNQFVYYGHSFFVKRQGCLPFLFVTVRRLPLCFSAKRRYTS
jgi:hypothetical protein